MLLAHTQTPSTNSPCPSWWSRKYSLRTHTFSAGRLQIKFTYPDHDNASLPCYEMLLHTWYAVHNPVVISWVLLQ